MPSPAADGQQANANIAATQNSAIHNSILQQQTPVTDNPAHHSPLNQLPTQLPSHIQQAMRGYYDSLNQQSMAQAPLLGNSSASGADPGQHQNHPTQQGSFPLLNVHQLIAQQQQARAAAGFHGLSNGNGERSTQANTPSPLRDQVSTTGPGNPLTALPRNTRIVQENHGPNGEHWRMIIESTQTVTSPHHHHHHHHPGGPNQLPRSSTPTRSNQSSPSPIPSRTNTPIAMGSPRMSLYNQRNANPSNNPSQVSLEQELLSIETALAGGTAPYESRFQSARALLQQIVTNGHIPQSTETALRNRIDHLSTQADQLRTSLNSILMRVVSEQSPSRRPTPPPPISTQPPTVYLLSSPSGPQALVVSPSGIYTASLPHPTAADSTPDHPTHPHPPNASNTQQNNPIVEANNQQPAETPNQNAPVQQQQQEQQENQARDLIRLVLPLGGHIWLLVRLFGFVYFFTGSGGHRHTILLGACAFLVFIAQTGLFRPFLLSVWEPVRRHIENLLPLATNDRAVLGGAPVVENANIPRDQVARRENGMPTPQQTAERLLREHERRDGSIMRRNLRRLERAVALFVASLVPGVGERHIAARDAAEAARREERNREETARREVAERRRGEGPTEGTSIEETGVQAEERGDTPNGQGAEPGGDRPLIDI